MKNRKEVISYKDYIFYENKRIYFFVVKKNIKNINIRIKSDKNIYLSVPINCKDSLIKECVRNKINWIIKNINKLDSFEKFKESYIFKDDEFVYFLGDKYFIKIISKKKNEKNSIYFCDNYIYIKIDKKYFNDNEYILKFYTNFLNEYALNLYNNIAFKYVDDIFYKYINKKNLIVKIRKMKSKWGVCMPYNNKIVINSVAIKLPICCIEYIIFHELSHFIYHSHDKMFYNFINKHMVNYRDRIKLINEKYKYLI